MRNKENPFIYRIYKPRGTSSFSVISSLKKKFPKGKELKIGHFGTLDPFADGLLLVGVYGATKLNQYLQKNFSKTYLAKGLLGIKTTTGDLEGEVEIEESSEHLKLYSMENIKSILEGKFTGEYLQVPPFFSATKFQGKRLYKYALEGEKVVKEPVKRQIYSLEILSFEYPYITFKAQVSSGTYIRSLFEDMAQELKTVGHLRELTRISIGSLKLEGSQDPEAFKKEDGLPLDKVYHLPGIFLEEEEIRKFCCGNHVRVEQYQNEFFWVYNNSKNLIGMGELRLGFLYPVWVFAQNAVS